MVLIAGLVFFAMGQFVPSLIFLFIGAFIFSTKYGIEIDLENKNYHDYVLLFGYKKGESNSFDEIKSVFITSANKTTRMQLRGHATDITKKEYNGYNKFSEVEKIHLLSADKKSDVEKLLIQMTKDLNVPMDDYAKEA